MVPRKLLRNQKEIKKIHEEIKDDYLFAVKKSIVDFVLKEPEIDEDERYTDKIMCILQFARNPHLHKVGVSRLANQTELVVKFNQVVFAVECDFVASNSLSDFNQRSNDNLAQLLPSVRVVDDDVLNDASLKQDLVFLLLNGTMAGMNFLTDPHSWMNFFS